MTTVETTTAENNFVKILNSISDVLLALNQGRYTDISYQMMSVKLFLNELRAEIEPQKSSAGNGIITMVYLEKEKKVDISATSIEAEKFAQVIGETIREERFRCVVHLKLPAHYPPQITKGKSGTKHEILFSNPVFHKGINITVRNGDKWTKAEIGDLLDIKSSSENKIILTATVTGKALIPFSIIPNQWLQNEHDPFCRNAGGLYEEMKRLYPDFSRDSIVTVLFFLV